MSHHAAAAISIGVIQTSAGLGSAFFEMRDLTHWPHWFSTFTVRERQFNDQELLGTFNIEVNTVT